MPSPALLEGLLTVREPRPEVLPDDGTAEPPENFSPCACGTCFDVTTPGPTRSTPPPRILFRRPISRQLCFARGARRQADTTGDFNKTRMKLAPALFFLSLPLQHISPAPWFVIQHPATYWLSAILNQTDWPSPPAGLPSPASSDPLAR